MTSRDVSADVGPDGRDTRWRDHREARRARVLQTAVEMIDRDGSTVSVSAIASESEIPRSVVYKLFKDREDLDDQIREKVIEEITASLVPLLVLHGTVRDMVRTGVSTYVDWVAAHPNLHRFLGAGSPEGRKAGSQVAAGGKEAFAHRLQGFVDEIGPTVLGVALPRGLSQNVAFALVGTVDVSVNRWVVSPKVRSAKEELIDFLTLSVCSILDAAATVAEGRLDVDGPLSY